MEQQKDIFDSFFLAVGVGGLIVVSVLLLVAVYTGQLEGKKECQYKYENKDNRDAPGTGILNKTGTSGLIHGDRSNMLYQLMWD